MCADRYHEYPSKSGGKSRKLSIFFIKLDSPRWRVGDPCFLLLRHDRPWNAWPPGGLNRVPGVRPCAVGQKWGLCPHRQKGLERRGEPRALSRLRNRLAARRSESRIRGGLGHGFTTLWPWARLSSSSPTRLTINDGIVMQVWLFKSIRYRYIIKGFSFPLTARCRDIIHILDSQPMSDYTRDRLPLKRLFGL